MHVSEMKNTTSKEGEKSQFDELIKPRVDVEHCQFYASHLRRGAVSTFRE